LGAGRLSAGIALALEAEAPGLRVRPVQSEGWDDWRVSLAAGERLGPPAPGPTLCDAIVTPGPGELTFPILAARAGPGIAVSDAEALAAMATAFERLKIVAEPGGAVALAAALHRAEVAPGPAVIPMSTGGNVNAGVFPRALAAGRFPVRAGTVIVRYSPAHRGAADRVVDWAASGETRSSTVISALL
jgi:Threonine dehydratase